MIKRSLRKGISFGLTSGTITTLGLMVGLHSGTHSRMVVIGGILTIAVADAFSDALGIESENECSPKEIWTVTLATLFSKFLFALTFIIPILIFKLPVAIIVSLVWGMSVLALLSYTIARVRNENPNKVI
ncbi:MAG: hypothetical protein JRJ39_14475, partial [Deltaproteobacteria bacterium]|nr:hypothetical protein [Deltaproteobacteria bacterium]